MSMRECVAIAVAVTIVLGGIFDIGVYLAEGYHATVTAIVRDWIAKYPGALLFIGMLVDHLFLK